MSAFNPKADFREREWNVGKAMSAFNPKADFREREWNVRLSARSGTSSGLISFAPGVALVVECAHETSTDGKCTRRGRRLPVLY